MDIHALDFEEPIIELEKRILEIQKLATEKDLDLEEEIGTLRSKLDKKLEDIFSDLSSWQRVRLARHPNRPITSDYLELIFEDLVELHGDRTFADDRAIICFLASLEGRRFLLVANKKGRDTQDRLKCNFGMPHPEGYRKAIKKMKLAEKFNLPVIVLINTPGAYPGIGAEERGQALAIAENLRAMSGLRTPIITVIISEGFSGGALGIGVGDRNLIFENGVFSVISPEGCAAILWKDGSKAEEAADVLKLTAKDLIELGVIDQIIAEPRGGAHRDVKQTAENLKAALLEEFDALVKIDLDTLLDMRYKKYRKMGEFLEKGELVSGTRRGTSDAD
jgi:acetyl-CoA carboxylase carboxyl transferase subunit alpha